jgi:hypothetical protein
MKVCYLIQTHKNPEQIYRLVRLIKTLSPDSQVIVSHDLTNCNLELAAFHDLSRVQVFQGKAARGSFALVQKYLDAVDWLLSHNIDFDWLINLTGQDYPTQHLSKIENFLAQTSYDGFIEYFQVCSKQSQWSIREGYSRYFYSYQQFIKDLPEWLQKVSTPLKVINYIQSFFRINFSYGLSLGVRASAPFNEDLICYGGSFFCTLSRKCIQYLNEFSRTHPDVVDYYRHVGVPEESFIQTVLLSSGLFNLCNDCKRYFDFSRSRNGHPRILTIDDYPSLLQDNIHFARKFDFTQDSKILDLLDARILNINQASTLEMNPF